MSLEMINQRTKLCEGLALYLAESDLISKSEIIRISFIILD